MTGEHVDDAAARCEAFLRAHLPPEWVDAIDRDVAAALAQARELLDEAQWWIDLADAGYVTPTWPVEYGGLGLGAKAGAEVNRVLGRYKVPRSGNPVGVGHAGAAIIEWGTDEQKARFLRPIARHEEVWCQLFSEPGAGSDVAGLSTRAVRDGDTWIVNGQKVWTSLGHIAAFGLLLARTDPDVPKHRGITAFILPMRQPGVTVRPLHHLTGDAEFNEVFLDDARIDDSLRLGEIDDGWRVAVSVLNGERQRLSGAGASLPGTMTGRSVEALIKRHAPVADAVFRQRLAQAYIDERVLALTNQRAAARRKAGSGGAEGSVTKLFHSQHIQRMQILACDLEGPAIQAWEEGDRYRKNTVWAFLWSRSRTIAGGTSEVQRNILGERVLGLPKEPSVDRDIPWSETLHS